jgi:hypothetical protein
MHALSSMRVISLLDFRGEQFGNEGPLLPLGHGLLTDSVSPGKYPQALFTARRPMDRCT